jgi:hypothetical protein
MRMRAIVFTIVLVAGCATPPPGDRHAAMKSWHGATYDEVVSRWGAPNDHTALADGSYVYTWHSAAVQPRASPSIGIFGGSGGFGIGTSVGIGGGGGEPVRCNRMLVFRDARVTEQTWDGDPGFCYNFRR